MKLPKSVKMYDSDAYWCDNCNRFVIENEVIVTANRTKRCPICHEVLYTPWEFKLMLMGEELQAGDDGVDMEDEEE